MFAMLLIYILYLTKNGDTNFRGHHFLSTYIYSMVGFLDKIRNKYLDMS